MQLSPQAIKEVSDFPDGYEMTPINLRAMTNYMSELRSRVMPVYEGMAEHLYLSYVMSSTIRELLRERNGILNGQYSDVA